MTHTFTVTDTFTLSATIAQPFARALEQTRTALAAQGFGILTEIDLAATLKAKLGVDLPPQVILGACQPELAYQAIEIDPSIATVLPCNVVVRAFDNETTVIEAFDPHMMTRMTDNATLDKVAADARARLAAALEALTQAS